jgi:septal ring factor EnvC (AmiA/AmiB activator)
MILRRAGALLISGLFASLLLITHHTAQAQSSVRDPSGVKQERDEVRRKLNALKKAITETNDAKKKVANALTVVENSLQKTQKRLGALDKERAALEIDINNLRSQQTQLQIDLDQTQSRLASVLRNQYQRFDVNPTQAWLAGQSASEAARESYWYERVSSAEKDLATQQAMQARELEALRLKLEKKQQQLSNTISEQNKNQRELIAQREERSELITSLNSKLKTQELERKRLQNDETRLSKVITDLARAIEEAKRKQALAAQQARRQDGSGQPNNSGAPSLPPIPNNTDFAKLKGRLVLPIQGTITGQFGQTRSKDGKGPSWKGIFIAADAGQSVMAIGPGRIVFSEWLRGFGEIVIIDHGDQFLSVYGNNSKLLKKPGDSVKAGEPIAETGNSSGNLDNGLYFELRHQGQPFDPLSWTKAR